MANNICTMCNGSGISMNYAKQVDPPPQKYGTILGDSPQRDSFKRRPGGQRGTQCLNVCLPCPTSSCPSKPAFQTGHQKNSSEKSTLIQIPCDPPTPCPKVVCQPCPPPPPTRIWLIKSSPMPQKSFCLPVGGSFDQGSSSYDGGDKPMVLCFPCQLNFPEQKQQKKPEEELKPIGFISRNKDMDFVGGKFITGCTCGRKNGLSGDCPRISCQNNPGCSMNPPRCWPQFKLPDPPPPPPPDQKMICVPFQLVYRDDPK